MQWRNKDKKRKPKNYQVIYKRGPSNLAWIFAGMAITVWTIFLGLSSFPLGAYLYYSVVPGTSKILAEALSSTGLAMARSQVPVPSVAPAPPTIVRDPSLPTGHIVRIPKIGVDTQISEAPYSEYESILRKGVWRVPDFGEPTTFDRPMILSAHRFGYLEWTQAYRRQNSFFNLPKLQAGDQIEVIWDQHLYTYNVERVEEGSEISDYSGDLILYTCKFLVSPLRYFVYARLVL